MDFFAKHYEKLILAFCLVLLLGGIAGVVFSTASTTKLLTENHASARRNVEGGNMVEAMKTDTYSVERYFNDPRKVLAIMGNPGEQTSKGSMLEPNKMIICANSECKHLLLLKMDVCPFCNEKEPELSKATGAEEDTDGDGIPDLLEQKYECLNYRDPTDALKDQDNDGFLNIEEVKFGTNPDDGADFPPLARLLRVNLVVHRELGIEFSEIEKNRSEEVGKWDVIFRGKDPKTGRQRRVMAQVGGEIFGRFSVKSVGFDGEGDAARPYAVIVPKDAPEEEYRLETGKKVLDIKPTVALIYLRTRDKTEVQRYRNRMRIVRKLGMEFQLSKNGGDADVVEYYKVVEASAEGKKCKVARLDAKGGKELETIDIPVFDLKNEKDFLFEDKSRDGFSDNMIDPGMDPEGLGRPSRGGSSPRGGRPPRPGMNQLR